MSFYRTGGRVLAVPIESATCFEYGSPSVLFDGPYTDSGGWAAGLRGAAGRPRFLMFCFTQNASARGQLVLVENWFEEFARLVPVEPNQ